MRALVFALSLAASLAHAEEEYASLDTQSIWVDARLFGAFAAATGGQPAYPLPGTGAPLGQLFRATYGYQRGTVGFELDAHLPRVGFGSVLLVAPTPLFRFHLTFGGGDQLAPMTEGMATSASTEGGLGYVLAIGNGVQLYRAKAFLLLGYFMVGLDGRPRWYSESSFLWAGPTLSFGLRALYETKRWRVRGGYEAQPPFFGRTEHRLELLVGLRPFENGVGPFFGLRLFGHVGQTPVRDAVDGAGPPTKGMSDVSGGLGLEVGL